jgi:hypothetical protein
MPPWVRKKSSSPKVARNRPKALLTAGWLMPNNSATAETRFFKSKWCKTTSRFRSSLEMSIGDALCYLIFEY